ncbi:hypothetical protein [Euzebya sp.]|uniref:hypothetical protein n=1 Tax=Euzebya sp. TaxID=1971409 RepID=UPI003513F4ED
MTLPPALAEELESHASHAAQLAAIADRAVETRDRWIVYAHRVGGSFREIGRAVGLSHVAVRKIVLKGQDDPWFPDNELMMDPEVRFDEPLS